MQNPVTKVNIAFSQHSLNRLSASPQPNDRADNHTQASSNDDHSKRPPTDNGGSDTSHLKHPKCRTLMSRVPKATAFCDILTKISTDPTQLDSWDCLFSFTSNIIAKPPKGESNRNLANVVLRRLAGLNDNPSATQDAKDKRFNKNPPDQDARLAPAITSKLEAGNFQAAVRLLCSDDVSAPTNAETLQALQDKHPSVPLDRKPACSPTENLRFQPLQVSPDDVIKCLRTFPAGSSAVLTVSQRSTLPTY